MKEKRALRQCLHQGLRSSFREKRRRGASGDRERERENEIFNRNGCFFFFSLSSSVHSSAHLSFSLSVFDLYAAAFDASLPSRRAAPQGRESGACAWESTALGRTSVSAERRPSLPFPSPLPPPWCWYTAPPYPGGRRRRPRAPSRSGRRLAVGREAGPRGK